LWEIKYSCKKFPATCGDFLKLQEVTNKVVLNKMQLQEVINRVVLNKMQMQEVCFKDDIMLGGVS